MALNQVGLERLNTATTKKIGTNKNIIINGAMEVAQRGTSSTSAGYQTVDRFLLVSSGTDEALTQAQVDVASGTTPYTLGFRKAFKATNGNQTSGAGAADLVRFNYAIEAQDLATSGWNYTSSSSYITLSFWIKSSVAQNFFFRLQSQDGTSQGYVMETGSLSADTWTKIIKTIPGNSNIQIDNNVEQGMKFEFVPFRGTNTTGTRPLNAWAAFDSATTTPDSTSTWYTTNDATLEWTGFQLEVGSVATDFEFRSFAVEKGLCERYFQTISRSSNANSVNGTFAAGTCNNNGGNGGILQVMVRFQTTMRAVPTMTQSGTFSHHVSGVNVADTTVAFSQAYIDGVKCTGTQTAFVSADGSAGELTSKYSDTSTAIMKADAEL
jgi:hypothetical protein